MKKVISIAIALSMVAMMMVGLSGCGEESKSSADDSSSTSIKDKSTSAKDDSSTVIENSTSAKDNSANDEIKLVSDTVNGMTISVPDDLSEFVDIKGIMRAKNDASTASIAITSAQDAGGSTPDAFNQENYQTTQMSTYTDVKFIEFNNKATLDGVPAVYAHATGKNANGIKLELYNYIIFSENGKFQSIVIVFSEGSNTFLEKNIKTVIGSIKLSK